MSVPCAIVDRNGIVAANVPEHIVAEVMASALVPNMGYRMECRPATEEEIYQLVYQLEQNRPPLPERSVRYKTLKGVVQQPVVVALPRGLKSPVHYLPGVANLLITKGFL